MTEKELQAQKKREEEEREAQEREAARIAAIEKEIAGLKTLESKYVSAADAVQAAKEFCDTEVSGCRSDNASYADQISDLVKPDYFEGEMAERLKEYAEEVHRSVDAGTAGGDALSGALGRQLGRIQSRINFIQNEISNLRRQI